MSYPRKLHILVVEDEESPRRSHEKTLELLSEDFPLCAPVIACSFEDGKRRLQDSAIYHLLILDLGLPAGVRDAVLDGVEPGIELLKLAATRDSYPIPSVLVISGRLGGSTSLPHISSLLQSFFFGEFVRQRRHGPRRQNIRSSGCGVAVWRHRRSHTGLRGPDVPDTNAARR